MELQPGDRRGGQAARGRDGDHQTQRLPERIALKRAVEARDEEEDRAHGGERELKAGIEQRVRIPRQQDDGADHKEMPTIGRTCRE